MSPGKPMALKPLAVDQGNFWTSHFGGLYIFRDVAHPAAIAIGPKDRLGTLPIAYVFDLTDRNMIARFLELNELVEPIVRARGIDAAAILGQKMDFILVEAAAQLGLDLGSATRNDLRNIARTVGSALPAEFLALGELKRWAEAGGPWPRIILRASGLFLHPARPAHARPRPGEPAPGRAVAARRAAALHLPQGTVLPASMPAGPRPSSAMSRGSSSRNT